MMMRQSSSRNQRSKKMKMKHALQFFVLLAISIWLLYQLKHTFDKRNTINLKSGNLEETPNDTIDETRLEDKIVKLGQKNLPDNVENKGDKYNELDEEEEEEKDGELDLLLEDERTGEDARTGGEEYDGNGEEGEEIQMDNKEEKEVNSSIELSNSSKNESSDANFGLEDNSKGFISNNQSVSIESSVKLEDYNGTEKLEPKDELRGIAIEGNSSQGSNGTDSSRNEASKKG